MKLSVYSINETLFEGQVEKIIAKTTDGEISILEDHIPLISLLKGPLIEAIDSGSKKHAIPVSSGVLEVRPGGEIVVLLS